MSVKSCFENPGLHTALKPAVKNCVYNIYNLKFNMQNFVAELGKL